MSLANASLLARQVWHHLTDRLFSISMPATLTADPKETPAAEPPDPQQVPSPHALHIHVPHPHVPRNINEVHRQEQASAGFNTQLAVWLTAHVGTMACAYLFSGIGIGSLVGAITGNTFLAVICGSVSSYFLQLVLLPILSVGQNVLGRKQELQADETYQTTMKNHHDDEQMALHLSAQDEVLVTQNQVMQQQLSELLKQTPLLEQILAIIQPQQSLQTLSPVQPPALVSDTNIRPASLASRTVEATPIGAPQTPAQKLVQPRPTRRKQPGKKANP